MEKSPKSKVWGHQFQFFIFEGYFAELFFYLILLISKIKKQNLCIFYIIKFKNQGNIAK